MSNSFKLRRWRRFSLPDAHGQALNEHVARLLTVIPCVVNLSDSRALLTEPILGGT